MKKTLFRFKVLLIAVFILSCTKEKSIEHELGLGQLSVQHAVFIDGRLDL